jgi:hypothetical protein
MKKRTLKFLSWYDPNAWMEKMKGPKWDNMVLKENKLFKTQVEKVCTIDELAQKMEEFKLIKEGVFFEYNNILLETHGYYENYFYNNSEKIQYIDFDIVNKSIYYINDVGKGSLKFRFNAPNWHLDNVGDSFFIKNGKVYLLKSENHLWYNSLVVYDVKGKMLKEIYNEKDKEFNLKTIKGENDCLFLIRENPEKQDLFVIENLEIIHSNNLYKKYFPIGYYNNKICYFYYEDVWKSYGFPFNHIFRNNIVYVNLQHKIIILKHFGKNIVYDFNFKEKLSYYGNIHLHPFSYKINPFENFYIDYSDCGIIQFNNFKPTKCKALYGNIIEDSVNKVHYILIKSLCAMKGVIIIGYGAYGASTNTITSRWKPYLEDGWGIVFAFIRGGGDVDYDWEMGAKTYNKIHSVEDFESVIKHVQKKYKISPNNTCIFGRSAGGYLVGSVVARNPKGYLFKMVYTEVPYVDILRTSTNPKLPLTQLEYKEFGNPTQNIYDFQKILEISPIDKLEFENPPDIFVLIRTSDNDIQVYAYEAYKWLHMLRGKYNEDKTKLLSLTKNSGHFIIGHTSLQNYSEDFFLLKSCRDNGKQ